jgi:hypothetical protein
MSDNLIAGFPRDRVKEAARALVDLRAGFHPPSGTTEWIDRGMEQVACIVTATQALALLLQTQQTESTALSAGVVEVMGEQGLLPEPRRQRVGALGDPATDFHSPDALIEAINEEQANALDDMLRPYPGAPNFSDWLKEQEGAG